jgi:hypothetical protein
MGPDPSMGIRDGQADDLLKATLAGVTNVVPYLVRRRGGHAELIAGLAAGPPLARLRVLTGKHRQ